MGRVLFRPEVRVVCAQATLGFTGILVCSSAAAASLGTLGAASRPNPAVLAARRLCRKGGHFAHPLPRFIGRITTGFGTLGV
jgi:hypothetical protein